MKLLTLNFITCARKQCKSSPEAFPLHPRDAELESVEADIHPTFIKNMLSRLDWEAMKTICSELGLPEHLLPETPPEPDTIPDASPEEAAEAEAEAEGAGASEVLKNLHKVLMETMMKSGKLVCAGCGQEYAVHEGVANFLLPAHLV